jgi:tight adherence protein C
MTTSVSVWPAAFLFLGIYLMFTTFDRWRNDIVPDEVRRRYVTFHARATTLLIDKGVLRFPGIRLVDPARSWIVAEVVLAVAVLSSLFLARTTGDAFLSLPLSMIFGICILYISLGNRCTETVRAFQQDLPLAAFLMSLLMESGMGSAAAMKETAAALPGRACARELDEILKGRVLGIPRKDLFDGSRGRVPLDDYRGFLNLVEQGERLGVGLSQGLNDLSRRMMEAQSHRAEILAQQAAVKMLLPLMVFIFPAMFLIVLSPVIMNICSMAGW